MRKQLKPEPKVGDKRLITWFAWVPVTIGTETRWLERVYVIQEYQQKSGYLFGDIKLMWFYKKFWEDSDFPPHIECSCCGE